MFPFLQGSSRIKSLVSTSPSGGEKSGPRVSRTHLPGPTCALLYKVCVLSSVDPCALETADLGMRPRSFMGSPWDGEFPLGVVAYRMFL